MSRVRRLPRSSARRRRRRRPGSLLLPHGAMWGRAPCVGPEGGTLQCAPVPTARHCHPCGPPVRQRHRPPSDEAGRARPGRADYRRRPRGTGEAPTGRAGDRPERHDGHARPDRRAHAHVQHADGEDVARARDDPRHPERPGRSARRLHRGARHELAQQRLRRRRAARRDQRWATSTGPVYRWRAGAFAGAQSRQNATAPDDPLAGTVVRSPRRAAPPCAITWRTASTGSSSIPTGAYSFAPSGEPQYVLTYPLTVLQAIIDETHRLGRKAACHAFGGDGLQNAITAGCDTIEHGYGLTQAQLDAMVAEEARLRSDARALHGAVHGRQRRQEHRREVPHDPDLREGGVDGRRHRAGSGRWWAAAWTGRPSRTARRRWSSSCSCTRAGMTPVRALQAARIVNAEVMGWRRSDRIDREGQVRRSRRRAGRSHDRHHRHAAGALRDEGRKGVRQACDYRLNSAQAVTSEPQNSIHFARSIGPLPTTFANRKSVTCSISRGCSVAAGSGIVVPSFCRSDCFIP